MTTKAPAKLPRSSAPRSRRRTRASKIEVVALTSTFAIMALLVVLFSDAAPVGTPAIDALYRAGFVALCGFAGARARRWAVVVAAALVAVGSDGWGLAPALVALVIPLLLAWKDRRQRIAGGVAGVLIGWAGLHLMWPASPAGATAALAATALATMGWSAYRIARPSAQGRALRALWVLATLAALACIPALVFAATQQAPLRAAADDTATAATAVADGGTSEAADAFSTNAAVFQRVADVGNAWWMFPTRLVPVVSQNIRAATVAAEAGADLSSTAGALAVSVDYDALQLDGGAIDLELLSSFDEPVGGAQRSIVTAEQALRDAQGPWLLGPVADQMDTFITHLVEAGAAASLADEAVNELPDLLGADGPRRYLLLLGNPAEARDLGGHLGNWAELVADRGRLEVIEVGDAYDLFGPGTEPRPVLSDTQELPASLRDMNPTRFPQNWSATADLHAAAAVAADLYPQQRPGAPLDGVLYADPIALAALLSLTGPIDADGVEIDADNAVEYLTRGQFAEGEQSVSSLVRTALDRFTDNQLPAPRQLADAFHDAVTSGHLQFALVHRDSELLELVGLDQPIAAAPGTDTLMVLSSNANPSKIDAYLRRDIDHQVTWTAATGELESRVVVTLHNDAPAGGLNPVVLDSGPGAQPGTNRTQLSVLSSQELLGVMVDGEARPWSTRSDVGGLSRYSIRLDVPPAAASTAVFDLRGAIDAGDSYSLTWFNQPLVNPDDARLVLTSTDRSFPGGGSEGEIELGNDRTTTVTATVEG